MIGYVGAAGIVVSIITFYYVTSYDPEQDPFRKENDSTYSTSSTLLRPNPFDFHLLGLKCKMRHLLEKLQLIKLRSESRNGHNQRLEYAFIKVCVFPICHELLLVLK